LIGGGGSKVSICFCLSAAAAAEKFSIFTLLSAAAAEIF
jgi:hypothetical protein